MLKNWNALALVYLVLAVIGAVCTWTLNVQSMIAGRNYFGDWFASGAAVLSLTVDVLWVSLITIIWMTIEARRIAMRRVWVYAILIFAVALAFAFPLFLANRERRLKDMEPTSPS